MAMFVKVTPRKKKGKTYYYAELVESYRDNGKIKHKRLLYFGSVDLDTANRLKIAFSKDFNSFTNIDKVDFASAVSYGNYYLINFLITNLKMFDYLSNSFVSSDNHISVQTAIEYIKAMVFQRIIQADSKLALVDSYPATPLRHFLDLGNELDLQSFYRSLEVLEENFPLVEKYLYQLAVKEFKQNEKELYYDITSSYFEGNKCIIAKYGYSRDKRKDKEQIVIGLVTTANGFPIKCNIYPGNTSDKTTVVEIVQELKRTYPIEEVVFVGDRGMLSTKNIKSIEDLKQKYVMAIPRAWSKKYLKNVLIKAEQMDKIDDELYAKFIPYSNKERFLLCLNINKKADDGIYRQSCINDIESELNKLIDSIGKNKNIKTRDDAMKKAGAISKLNNTGKYFSISTVDSKTNPLGFTIKYKLKEEKINEDKRLDGTFLIQTNEESYSRKKLLDVYKNLSKVENAFKIIKNDLDIRPIYHRKESKVKGHVYICVISYFLIIAIEYLAKNNNLNKSARNILRELDRIKLIELNLPDGEKKYSITSIDHSLKEILRIYKIKKMEVPEVVV
jgi:transposase